MENKIELTGKTVGQRLKQAREWKQIAEGRQISQQEVADSIGILQETYNRWERDKVRLKSPEILEKLAVYFGTTVDNLTREHDGLAHLPREVQQFLRDTDEIAIEEIIEAYTRYTKRILEKAMGRA